MLLNIKTWHHLPGLDDCTRAFLITKKETHSSSEALQAMHAERLCTESHQQGAHSLRSDCFKKTAPTRTIPIWGDCRRRWSLTFSASLGTKGQRLQTNNVCQPDCLCITTPPSPGCDLFFFLRPRARCPAETNSIQGFYGRHEQCLHWWESDRKKERAREKEQRQTVQLMRWRQMCSYNSVTINIIHWFTDWLPLVGSPEGLHHSFWNTLCLFHCSLL